MEDDPREEALREETSREPFETEFAQLSADVQMDKPIKWHAPKPVSGRKAVERQRQLIFLEAFRECGIVSKARKAAGINASTELRWRKSDDKWYQDRWKEAWAEFRDKVVTRVHEWALEGVDVPIVGKRWNEQFGCLEDEVIGMKKQYSENILMFLAKQIDPTFKEKYEKPSDAETIKVESPLARITIELDRMESRRGDTLSITTTTKADVIDVQPIAPDDNAAED